MQNKREVEMEGQKGGVGRGRKMIKIRYGYTPNLQSECNYYVSQTYTNQNYIKP